MEKTLDVSIIIVSHNTRDITLAALRAVHATVKTHTFEVIVVENASTDGSYDAIKKAFPHDLLVRTEALVGFSAANNLGAQSAHGDHLFFLNPDTVVQDGAVDLLIEHQRSLPSCGAITGQLLHADGSIQPQGGALPHLLNVTAWMFFIDDLPGVSKILYPYQQRDLEFFRTFHENCGWVGGTALMIPKTVFEKVGGWDSAIFLYGEDVELCQRIHKAGKHVCFYPGAKVIHLQNKSMGGSRRAKVGEIEGLVYFWKKHRARWQLPLLRIILFAGSWLRVLLFGILMRNEEQTTTYLHAQKRALMA